MPPRKKKSDTPTKAFERRRAFVREYVKDWNARQAAIRAGYSEKTAGSQASQLLKDPRVMDMLREIAEEARTDSVASATEVLEFFTSVMRGEIDDAGKIQVAPGEWDLQPVPAPLGERRRAAESLARYHSLFIDKVEHTLRKDPSEMTMDEIEEELRARGAID